MAVALFSEATVSTSLTLGTVPSARVGPTITPHGTKLYVFGGRHIIPAKVTNELYCFDLGSMAWELVTPNSSHPLPDPRYFHSAVLCNDYLVVVGGQGEVSKSEPCNVLNDICMFSFKTKEWEIIKFEQTTFPPRYAHLSCVSGNRVVILGGQDASNQYLNDIYFFDPTTRDLRRAADIDTGLGSYRSTLSPNPNDPGSLMIFTNTRFNNPLRELLTIDSDGKQSKYQFTTTEKVMPPAFRFPEGYIIGESMVVSGTYISNNVQSYCLWSVNITTNVWSRLDTGSCFARGSWNRSVLHPSDNKFIVFGHREREIVYDYNQRRINFNHISIVNLEAFDILRPPKTCNVTSAMELGLLAMYEPRYSNFSLITNDDFRIQINSGILRSRWTNFDAFLYNGQEHHPSFPHIQPCTLVLQESYPVVQAFVRYLYTNNLNPEQTNDLELLGRLLVFARNYYVQHLSDLIAVHLHKMLDIRVAPRIYQVASMARRDGLKLRSLSIMIQDRQQLLEDVSFWRNYPESLRREILRFMPPNFNCPAGFSIESPSKPSKPIAPPSRKLLSSVSETRLDTKYSTMPSISRHASPSQDDLRPSDSPREEPTQPKKKTSGSSFLKFGGRRPSLANLFNFSSSSNTPPLPQTASAPSTAPEVSSSSSSISSNATSPPNPVSALNASDVEPDLHVIRSLYDFGLS